MRNDKASKENPTQVAVVGAGYWGTNLVRVFHELGALAAVCDTDRDKLIAIQRRYKGVAIEENLSILLERSDLPALVIATPAEVHFAMALKSILAGKDVLIEKPLALTAFEGEELVRLAESRRQILMVGHLLWYHPAIQRLKELVDCGELGRLQYIYSNRLNLGRIRREENILWSFAPHDISVILGLVGEMPERVQAQGGYYLHKKIADVTVTTMTFPSGVCAHVFVSWLHPYKEQRLVVVGDRKMAVFNGVEPEQKLLLYPHTIDWRENIPIPNPKDAEAVAVEEVEPLRAECEHFLECQKTRTAPRTDGEEALRVLRVLALCQEALENGDNRRVGGDAGKTVVKTISNRNFVHPTAAVDTGAEVGAGTKIWHYSHVMSGARIGENCIVGQNVMIASDVVIGNNVKIQNNVSVYTGVVLEDEVFCGPSVVFTNVNNPRSAIPRKDSFLSTFVKRGATLGANSTIICNHTIGQYAFVGAGAVVTKDVPDYALVVGNPAQLIAWVCQCGLKLTIRDGAAVCSDCKREYQMAQDKLVFARCPNG